MKKISIFEMEKGKVYKNDSNEYKREGNDLLFKDRRRGWTNSRLNYLESSDEQWKVSGGDHITLNCNEDDNLYIVARCEFDRYVLISVKDGNRWRDPVKCLDYPLDVRKLANESCIISIVRRNK
jgi:hypothetical protein